MPLEPKFKFTCFILSAALLCSRHFIAADQPPIPPIDDNHATPALHTTALRVLSDVERAGKDVRRYLYVATGEIVPLHLTGETTRSAFSDTKETVKTMFSSLTQDSQEISKTKNAVIPAGLIVTHSQSPLLSFILTQDLKPQSNSSKETWKNTGSFYAVSDSLQFQSWKFQKNDLKRITKLRKDISNRSKNKNNGKGKADPDTLDDTHVIISTKVTLDSTSLAPDNTLASSLTPSAPFADKPQGGNFSNYETPQTVTVVLCVGATPTSTLYATYSLIERLTPVRFALDGDILPDRPRTTGNPDGTSNTTRLLDSLVASDTFQNLNITMKSSPGAAIRGIQPFHDFSEGPDWWNLQEYKHHLDQMLKMKFNFIGLHTYPLQEPTVWTGLVSDIDTTTHPGHVRRSYVTSYMNSLRGGDWGGIPLNTSDYFHGSWQVFPADCYGSKAQMDTGTCPYPTSCGMSSTNDDDANGTCNALFNTVGDMLGEAFVYAKSLGHYTCVGTEAPLRMPPRGLSPHQRMLGFPGEEQNNIDTIPDKKPTAKKQNKSETPTVTDYYRGIFKRINMTMPIDYYWIWTSEGWDARFNASIGPNDPIIKEIVDDYLAAYEAKTLDGYDHLTLATGGWTVGPMFDRTYFDSVLPPQEYVITSINEALGNTNIEPEYANITNHEKWSIPWMEDDPGLIGVQLWANRTLQFASSAEKLGSTGLLGVHWRTRAIRPQLQALAKWPWDSNLTSEFLYRDMARTSFGLQEPQDVESMAHLWERLDSYDNGQLPEPLDRNPKMTSIPRPDGWVGGPGKILPQVYNSSEFGFVDEFEAFRHKVLQRNSFNAISNFNYWSASFQYLRWMARTAGHWFDLNQAISLTAAATTVEEKKKVFHESVVPARSAMVNASEQMMNTLTQTVYTTGEMGTLANIQHHSFVDMFNGTEDMIRDIFRGQCTATRYVRCVVDDPLHALEYTVAFHSKQVDQNWCAARCDDLGYRLAGVEDGTSCYCGNSILPPPPSPASPSSDKRKVLPMEACHETPCGHNSTQPCGGSWKMLIYEFNCPGDSAVSVPSFPPDAQPKRQYTGKDRLFVLTPSSYQVLGEPLNIHIMAFTKEFPSVPPIVRWRPLGSNTPWNQVNATRTGDAKLMRQVYHASISSTDDWEYYVDGGGTIPDWLIWPYGGAANPHTVVVIGEKRNLASFPSQSQKLNHIEQVHAKRTVLKSKV